LEITPASRIQRIVIEEVDGTTTEFRFSNFEENKAVSDKQFSFTAPPGVEMVEAKDLQGE
jgi:outer membrane lipoprotein-sorting protein